MIFGIQLTHLLHTVCQWKKNRNHQAYAAISKSLPFFFLCIEAFTIFWVGRGVEEHHCPYLYSQWSGVKDYKNVHDMYKVSNWVSVFLKTEGPWIIWPCSFGKVP